MELLAGLLDVADEDSLEAVKRESVEEAGLEARSWPLLIDAFNSPDFTEEVIRTYLTRGLRIVDRPEAHDEEANMTVSWIAVDEAVVMVLRGEILNGIALSGILLAVEVLLRGMTPRSVAESFDIRPIILAKR